MCSQHLGLQNHVEAKPGQYGEPQKLAKVARVDAFSGHADREELSHVQRLSGRLSKVSVVHERKINGRICRNLAIHPAGFDVTGCIRGILFLFKRLVMKRSLRQLVWFDWLSSGHREPLVLPVWPGVPPEETSDLRSEHDTTTESSEKVAGQRVIRLTDVHQPTLTVYSPEASVDTGASVLICPGGVHQILAMDLEGTEVAQWLNRTGVSCPCACQAQGPVMEIGRAGRSAIHALGASSCGPMATGP